MLRTKRLLLVRLMSVLVLGPALSVGQSTPQSSPPAAPKKAGEAFKNIQVLKDMPENLLFFTMSFFTDSLGVSCEHCHEQPVPPGNWSFEKDTPNKNKARKMIAMVREMNNKYFDGAPTVSCNTCHRGTLQPVGLPAADLDHWVNSSKPAAPLPEPQELVARYRKATGITSGAFHTQAVSFTTSTYGWKTAPSTVTAELLISSAEQTRMITKGSSGRKVSVRNGKEGWVEDASGRRPLKPGEVRNLANEASAFELQGLEEFSMTRTLNKSQVHGRDAYVVEATSGNTRAWLFFDAQNGLLLRQRTFFASFFADGSWDVEFDDYRPVGKLMLPFIVRVLNPAGSGAVIRQATARALDVPAAETPDQKP